MELLDSHSVRFLPAFDGPLLSLGDAFASRFHSWRGASARRYVMSVFPADPAAGEFGPPDFDAGVVVAVAREGRCRRMTGIFVVDRASDRRRAMASWSDADEWHIHLLARDRRERASVAADLRERLESSGGAGLLSV